MLMEDGAMLIQKFIAYYNDSTVRQYHLQSHTLKEFFFFNFFFQALLILYSLLFSLS